jgi:AP-1-like factor
VTSFCSTQRTPYLWLGLGTEGKGTVAMDYSYFSAGPQPYQFFGLPPTPGQSNTPPPGDYSRPVLSPVRINEDPPNRFPTSDMDAAFAAFQQNFRYDPTSFGTQHRNSLSQSPTKSPRKDSTISIPDGNGNRNGLQPIAADISYEDQQRARSSSEEKESLTPAQSRRKAQNRAA